MEIFVLIVVHWAAAAAAELIISYQYYSIPATT